jgi:hypothetical protein
MPPNLRTIQYTKRSAKTYLLIQVFVMISSYMTWSSLHKNYKPTSYNLQFTWKQVQVPVFSVA